MNFRRGNAVSGAFGFGIKPVPNKREEKQMLGKCWKKSDSLSLFRSSHQNTQLRTIKITF